MAERSTGLTIRHPDFGENKWHLAAPDQSVQPALRYPLTGWGSVKHVPRQLERVRLGTSAIARVDLSYDVLTFLVQV
jgi:hypothetical protein